MQTKTLEVLDGPDKPALQWAVAYPDRGQTVSFKLPDATVEATIAKMDETDGFEFDLEGVLVSEPFKGRRFEGHYSVETRSGSIALED
jgi:hypothetical protein